MDEQNLLHELREQIEVLRLAKTEVDEALRHSRQQNQALFDRMLDVYYQSDMDGNIRTVSPSCLSQTGYRPEEVIGRSTTDFYVDPSRRDELIQLLYRDGKVNDFTIEMIHKDGTLRFASLTCWLTLDENQQPVGIEGILRNVTERKRIESEQQRLLEENRKLMRQLMQVQEQERRLLALALHDELGQLLTSIDANASYISKHSDNADIRATAEEILRDTQASFRASHDVLMRLRPGTLDTLGLAAALQELAGHWDKKQNLHCSLTINGEIDRLDEKQAIAVYRLVQEGLTNAYRHGKAGCVKVVVALLQRLGRKEVVQVEIADDGKGSHVETQATGMGIIGMRERVHALGGTFMLTNLPADGVRIEAVIPLEIEGDA
ncbi:MAG TPA: PAS domain-containing sensor histidine kinase [Mariprofundaceae bacterium]|nr:PAS domain-containing sensor histidine kinase [Mariprofundaceae bacterium]